MLTLVVPRHGWEPERARLVLEAHRQGRRALHIVGGNRLDVYALANAARAAGLDPVAALRSSVIARAFTAHQLSALIEDTLPQALTRDVALVLVSDPLDVYAGEDVGREEGSVLLQRAASALAMLAGRRRDVRFIVVQDPRQGQRRHWRILEAAAHAVAAWPSQDAHARQATLEPWIVRPVRPALAAHKEAAVHA